MRPDQPRQSFGHPHAILQSASTEDRRRVYEAAQLSITYDHSRKMAKLHASPDPEVWSSVRVGGGVLVQDIGT